MADHGVPKPDNTKRNLRRCWVDHNQKYYQNTSLRHVGVIKNEYYAGKDLMNELLPAAHERGMTVYERLYEPHGEKAKQNIKNYEKVLEIDFEGNKRGAPCLNHPEYRNWIIGTMRDLFNTYPLDGIQFGAERSGPMGSMLHWNNKPGCFCPHCQQRMKDNNIDPNRLREGFAGLYQYLQELRAAKNPAAGGAWYHYLRYLMQYPEMLGWAWQWHRAQNELHQMVYDTIKDIDQEKQVGRHVACVESAMDMFYRAAAPYEEMAGNNDFVKFIAYPEITGPRLNWWHLTPLGKTIYKGIPHELILQWFYAQKGHDPSKNPKLKHLDEGLTPSFVYTETNRAVADVKGKTAIYPGIGMDIPKGEGWGTEPWPSDPKLIYDATVKAFEAGARGVVASREYEEITLESLKAYGDAFKEMN
jgi:hypothetical protein